MLSYTQLAVTVAEADAYALARGWADWTGAEPTKTSALRRGQDYIANLYNARWATTWANDEAPEGVKMAIFEASRRELVNPGSLMPDYEVGKQVTREKSKVGPLEEEIQYAQPTSASDARPVLGAIEGLLSGLLASAGGLNSFKLTRA